MRVLSIFALFLLALPATAQFTWTEQTPTGNVPSQRYAHATAYDRDRKKVVMFAGWREQGYTVLGDTWEWDGSTWSNRTPASGGPSPRTYSAMAYDAARKQVILFGGFNFWASGGPTSYGDTWAWDGIQWTDVTPTTTANPPAGAAHSMTYDSKRQRVILFRSSSSSDIWEWDGARWHDVSRAGGPTERAESAIAFDSDRGVTVLFGGYSNPGGYHSDVWEWDGNTWTDVTPASGSPHARKEHAMVYDPVRKRMVLFGGFWDDPVSTTQPFHFQNDVWEWDGAAWTDVTPAGSQPSPRSDHGMVYDSSRHRFMSFGGKFVGVPSTRRVYGETWEAEYAHVAKFTPYGTGCGTPAVVLTAQNRPIIGQTFTTVTTNLPASSTMALLSMGASDKFFGGWPLLPMDLSSFGLKGCFLYHSYDVTMFVPVNQGIAWYAPTIPSNPNLLGTKFFMQTATGSVASNGAEVVVGNQ